MPEIKLFELSKKDIEEIYEIDRICFPPEIAFDKETFSLYIEDNNTIKIGARLDNKIIGFILVYLFYEFGEILTIDILPEYRRMGIGKILMKEAEKRMRENSVIKVFLEVAVNNKPAIEFYKKLGYRIEGIIPSYYPPDIDAYSMEKELKD